MELRRRGDLSLGGYGQADRFVGPTFARQAFGQGVTASDLRRIAACWRTWGDAPDAWFAILHGELLVRLPTYEAVHPHTS